MPEERIVLGFEVKLFPSTNITVEGLHERISSDCEKSDEINSCLMGTFRREASKFIETKNYVHDGFRFVEDRPTIFPLDPEFDETEVEISIDYYIDVKTEDYDKIADLPVER